MSGVEKIAIIAVIALIPLALRFFIRVAPQAQATVRQIPELLAQLSRSQSYPVFAAFVFSAPDQPGNDNAINLQFSLEDGKAGFDWVLIAPRNLRDEDRFLAFARTKGFEPNLEEMNSVRYWRIEQGDIADLCARIISVMYGMPDDQPIDLVIEGFEWKPPAA